jgi:predicted NAD/FAD-binding protein
MCTRLSENPALNVFPFDKLLDMMSFSQKWRDIYLSPLLNILFLDTKHMYKTSARFMCNIFGGKNKIIDLLEGQEAFTVQGGTQDTWNRVRACFPERVKTDCGVAYVKRQPPGTISGEEGPTVLVVLEDGTHHVFDHVVLCLNGRAAALLLNNGNTMTSLERLFFSQVRYNTEISYLHTDSTFLPEMEMTRNFNYFETTEMDHPQLTGSMIHVGNRPEGLLAPNGHNTRDVKHIPLLTTSPYREIEEEKIVKVS